MLLKRIGLRILKSRIMYLLPDTLFLYVAYYLHTGKVLSLRDPKSLSEKLQWRKLHDRNPLYTMLADKYEVRTYVEEKIGGKYLVPILGKWNQVNEINESYLPEYFVLKCNHDSGSTIIYKKDMFLCDTEGKKLLSKYLKRNYYYAGREWPYKNIVPCVFAEEMISAKENIYDLKFLCFHGIPKVIICYGEEDNCKTMTYYDVRWNKMPCSHSRYPTKPETKKPACLDELLSCAEALAAGIPFVRVDFFLCDTHAYFSEMTFFPSSGFAQIVPEEYELLFGSWI